MTVLDRMVEAWQVLTGAKQSNDYLHVKSLREERDYWKRIAREFQSCHIDMYQDFRTKLLPMVAFNLGFSDRTIRRLKKGEKVGVLTAAALSGSVGKSFHKWVKREPRRVKA